MSEPYLNKKMFKYVEVNAKFTIRYFFSGCFSNMIFVEQEHTFFSKCMYSQTKYYVSKCTKNISNAQAKESLTCSTHLDFSPIKANLGVSEAEGGSSCEKMNSDNRSSAASLLCYGPSNQCIVRANIIAQFIFIVMSNLKRLWMAIIIACFSFAAPQRSG